MSSARLVPEQGTGTNRHTVGVERALLPEGAGQIRAAGQREAARNPKSNLSGVTKNGYSFKRQTTPSSSQYQSVSRQMLMPWGSGSVSASWILAWASPVLGSSW